MLLTITGSEVVLTESLKEPPTLAMTSPKVLSSRFGRRQSGRGPPAYLHYLYSLRD